jgi:GNAT superfamily N-acetyltransferase
VVRDLAVDSDTNLWGTWRHIGSRTKLVDEDDDLLITETGAAIPTFNPVFVKRIPDDAEALVRRAIDRTAPVVITANPALDGLERLLAAADATGLVGRERLPGMVMALDGPVPGPPAALEIREADSGDEWDAYFDVLCEGFEVPHDVVAPMIDPSVYDSPDMAALLGFVDGQPVTTSLASVVDDTAGVYNVATVPSHRRRGYGAVMTWAAAAWGRARGCAVAVLQASAMGQPLYEEMGFVEIVPYVQLIAPA